jgi:uncharacterized protein YjiS (DUF1127 family)
VKEVTMSRAIETPIRAAGILGRIAAGLRRHNARRRAQAELSRLDGHLLADIGVRPEQVAANSNRLGRALRPAVADHFADLVREFDGPAAPLHPVANDRGPASGAKVA